MNCIAFCCANFNGVTAAGFKITLALLFAVFVSVGVQPLKVAVTVNPPVVCTAKISRDTFVRSLNSELLMMWNLLFA